VDRAPEQWRHRRTVAARFGDTADARAAIEALQSAGIDGDDIALLSPFPDESRRSTNAADERMGRYLVRRVLLGALVGIVGGIFGGALIGGIVIALTAPGSALGQFVAFAIAGAVIGAPLGAYIGFERAGTLSEAWGTTFDDLEHGVTWVGVKVHDEDDYVRARRALERRQPVELRELETPDR
jgi:hypothetical protein